MDYSKSSKSPLPSDAEQSQAKRRRMQNSSDEDSYDGPPDLLTPIRHSYEPHRIGAPPLQALPLNSTYIYESNEVKQKYLEKTFQGAIDSILAKYEIDCEDRSLVVRHIDLTPGSDAVTTLYIQTLYGLVFNAERQRNCVAELYSLLKAEGVAGPQGTVTVEMVGYPLWAPKGICHVEPQHPFLRAWDGHLRKAFQDFLRDEIRLKGRVQSIDVVRLGFDVENPSRNPIVVSITVGWTVKWPDWRSMEKKMVETLENDGHGGVEVGFECGEVMLVVDQEPKLAPLSLKEASLTSIRPGSSISYDIPGPLRRPFGTAGVVMEVVKSSTSEVVATVVLTSYHVMRPAFEDFVPPKSVGGSTRQLWSPPKARSLCEKMDGLTYWEPAQTSGLKPVVEPHHFRSPCSRRAEDTIEALMSEIADITAEMVPGKEDKNRQKGIDDLQEIIMVVQDPSSYPIQKMGGIFYSGGINERHAEHGRLDVAAIRISGETLGKASNNIAHRQGEWHGAAKPLADSITSIDMDFGRYATLPFAERRLFKIGAMTACTDGTVTSEKIATVHLPWHKEGDFSNEVAVVGKRGVREPPFSWKGDSGAAVFDRSGKWLGLVFGGQTKLNTEAALSYIIPAWAILADVKKQSNDKMELRLKV